MKQITSLQHPLVKHWSNLSSSKEYRLSSGRLLIPGHKMVQEAANSSKVITLIALPTVDLSRFHLPESKLFFVTEPILKKITGLEHPETIAAEVALPSMQSLEDKMRLVVLDGVSDPGNVGTLIRTAHALGWDGLFLVQGSCDPFNPKALRAAKGASLKMPLCMGTLDELFSLLERGGYQVFIADLKGKPLEEVTPKAPLALILGSESHGIQARLK